MIVLKDYQCIFSQILERYGIPHRLINCIEELAELQKAITKQLRFYYIHHVFSDTLTKDIISEVADVYITIEETKNMFHISDEEINEIIKFKINRGVR